MAALGQDGTTAKDQGLWSETDGFFYDSLRLPDGSVERMRCNKGDQRQCHRFFSLRGSRRPTAMLALTRSASLLVTGYAQ